MSLDDRDYMRKPRYSPAVPRRPWWKKIRLQPALATALAIFTVGSAGIWFLRDLAGVSAIFGGGSREGALVVNVNTATTDELETLPGIGPALARLIVAGRPYDSVEDLERVRGIGPATVASLRPLVRVEGETEKAQ